MGELKSKGIITEEEFNEKKKNSYKTFDHRKQSVE